MLELFLSAFVTLFVVIDPANAVSERNEANNLLSSDVPSPLE